MRAQIMSPLSIPLHREAPTCFLNSLSIIACMATKNGWDGYGSSILDILPTGSFIPFRLCLICFNELSSTVLSHN